MASRLLCQHHTAVLARQQMYRSVALRGRGRFSRRLLSASSVACKTGREWDYIDGPTQSPKAKNQKPSSISSSASGPNTAEASSAGKSGRKPAAASGASSDNGSGVPPGTVSSASYGNTNNPTGSGTHSSTSARDDTARGNSGTSPPPALPPQAPSNGMEPISPRMIMRYLDEYVIGQERAKKTLAVAVYNHYNRVRANTLKRQREQLSAAFAAASPAVSAGASPTANGSASMHQSHAFADSADRQSQQHPGRNGTGSAYPTHQYPFVNRPWNGAFENGGLFIQESEIAMQTPPSSASSASSQPDASQKGQLKPPPQPRQHPPAPAPPSALESSILDTQLEKSNVLLLGPTGSGKTLLAKTLAQILDVPFSVSDATPLTQAGYVGEDVEVVIQRLMQSCDYDVARAEQGIVFIDEIDKIARKPDSFSMSKDVSGEGVQQGLLRMLEGTIVTITDKSGHSGSGSGHPGPPSPFPPHGMGSAPQAPPPGLAPSNLGVGGPLRRGGPLSGAFGPSSTSTPPGGGGGGIGGLGGGISGPLGGGKGEVYHVDTSNILFILSGAFVGLDRLVMERVAKASIGFGNPVRKIGDTSTPVDLKAMNVAPVSFAAGSEAGASSAPFNPLDYTEPSDLIKFGLIPEFIGRLPVVTSVGALDKDSLVRVLVEPKNALVRQYEALLALSGAQLHITKPALYTIAQQAIDKQTGARGLRRIMENLLLEPMFDCPGSSIRHIVIDSEVAAFKKRPLYFSKIQEADVEAAIWNDEHRSEPSPKMQQQQQQQAGGAEKKRSIASSA